MFDRFACGSSVECISLHTFKQALSLHRRGVHQSPQAARVSRMSKAHHASKTGGLDVLGSSRRRSAEHGSDD